MANRVSFELTSKQEQAVRGFLDLVKAQDKAVGAHGRATGAADRYEKKIRSATATIGKMYTGVVALAGTYGLVRLTQNAFSTADAIAKTADKIGITTDALQELRGAGKLTGIEIAQMDMALTMLGRNLGEFAKTGAGEAKGIITGFSKEFQEMAKAGAPVDVLLEKLGDEFQTLGSRNEQLAAAQKLAGRSGTILLNLLDKQSGGIRNMRQELRDAGVVIEEKFLRAAEAANDSMGILADQTMARFNAAILTTAPALNDFVSNLSVMVTKAGEFYKMTSTGLDVMQDASQLKRLDEWIAKLEQAKKEGKDIYNWSPSQQRRLTVDESLAEARARRQSLLDNSPLNPFRPNKTTTTTTKPPGTGGMDDEPLDKTASAAKEAADKLKELTERTKMVADDLGLANDEITGLAKNAREAVGSVATFGRSLDEAEDRRLAAEAREASAQALREREAQVADIVGRMEKGLIKPGGPPPEFMRPGEHVKDYLARIQDRGSGEYSGFTRIRLEEAFRAFQADLDLNRATLDPNEPTGLKNRRAFLENRQLRDDIDAEWRQFDRGRLRNPHDALRAAESASNITFVVDTVNFQPSSAQVRFLNQRKAVDGLL